MEIIQAVKAGISLPRFVYVNSSDIEYLFVAEASAEEFTRDTCELQGIFLKEKKIIGS